MNKVLIIGSQGYLGSRLTDYLQSLGYECTGADVGYFQYGVLYQPKNVSFISKSAEQISSADIKGHDVVVMLAGISNDPFGNIDPRLVYDPTREYAKKIAQCCKDLGVRYIFPSSCSVYGYSENELNEDAIPNPLTGYSLNKAQIEQDLADLSDKNFSPIALRLATVFGSSPRMRFDIVINMLCGMATSQKMVMLNSNGEAWRPHVSIEDVCEAFRCCIDWEYNGGKLMVLNVGRNDNNLRIIDVAKIIQERVDGCRLNFLDQESGEIQNQLVRDSKIQDGVDKRNYRVNFDLIHNKLPGFEAASSVSLGVEKLLSDLSFWKLDEVKFNQRDFYRLQQMSFLYETDQIRLIS